MRELNKSEKDLVVALVDRLSPVDRDRVLSDLDDCLVEAVTGGSRLQFVIKHYERPPYKGQHSFPTEGVMQDDDGADISVILYGDENNRILELEFIRWGEGEIIKPNWCSFRTTL